MQAPLPLQILIDRQFRHIGSWQLDAAAKLIFAGAASTEPGVYAFVMDGMTQYVGVASASLSKRLYFYSKPGVTQRTNLRINALLCEALTQGRIIDVYIATPPHFEWNGWTVSGPEGLEAGIIKSYVVPWNMRGAPKVVAVMATPKPMDVPEVASHEPTVIRSGPGGRYQPLCEFLRSCPQNKVSMTFARIEQLVGPLPNSASLHRAWWANHEGNAQAKGWMPARFVAEPDPSHRSVVFRRFTY